MGDLFAEMLGIFMLACVFAGGAIVGVIWMIAHFFF